MQDAKTYIEVLRRTAQMLSGVLRESEIIEVMLGEVDSILSARKSLVLLLSRGGNEFTLAGAAGMSEFYLSKLPTLIAMDAINGRAMAGEMVVIGDLADERDFKGSAAEREGLRSMIAVPLIVRDHIIGVLHVYPDPGVIQSPENMMLLAAIADFGALALERTRLHQSLYRIAEVLNSSLELKPTLQRVLEATVQEMWLKAASIRLLDQTGRALVMVASHGLSDAYRGKGEVHVEKSEIDRRVLGGEAVVLYDVLHDPGFEYPQDAAREGILSVLAVPLKLKTKTLGVMRAYSAQPRHFCSVGINFLKSVADLVSLSIENAELYSALQTHCSNLKGEVAEWRRFLVLG